MRSINDDFNYFNYFNYFNIITKMMKYMLNEAFGLNI